MDVFSTEYLAAVVQDLKVPPSFALDRYFGSTQTFDTEAVDVDIINRKRRIAPLVSPYVPGKLMNQVGRETRTIKPAYTKDKRVFSPATGFKRAVGEQIGGALSPAERIQLAIAAELEDQIKILQRRQELMAIESLRTGKLVLSADQYPTTTVDFQRDAGLTVDISGGAGAWDQNGVNPLDDLETWALLTLNLTGIYANDVVMATNVFKTFRENPFVKERWQALQAQNQGTNLQLGGPIMEGGSYRGSIDGFNIFVYAGWYVDENDAEQQILPDGELFMAAPQIEGTRLYGAIKDLESLVAAPYFPKSWIESDPSVRYLMLQSAPLVAPLRPNASVGAKVL